jgi:hypothetical protein
MFASGILFAVRVALSALRENSLEIGRISHPFSLSVSICQPMKMIELSGYFLHH